MRCKLGFLTITATLLLGHFFYGARLLGVPRGGDAVLAGVFLLNLMFFKVFCFRQFPLFGRSRRFLRGMNALVCLFYGMCAVLVLESAWHLLVPWFRHIANVATYPLSLNAVEGRETVKAWLLAHGSNIYSSLGDHPFLVTIYPPVYHIMVAAAAPFLGWTLETGRIISLGCFLILIGMACLITLRFTSSWLAALSVSCMLLFIPMLQEWSMHARPDMLAWCLALAGVWCFVEACAREQSSQAGVRLAVTAGIVFCLAMFTKQQALPYFLGTLVWGAGRRAWRPTVAAALAALVLGLVLFGCVQAASGGCFLRNCFVYPSVMSGNPDLNTFEFLLQRLGHIWDQLRALIVVLFVYFAWAAWRRRWDLPMVLTVVNAVFMAKLLATWGADINYAIGTLITAVMCVGTLVGHVVRLRPQGPAVALTLLLAWLPASASPEPPPPADVSWVSGLSGTVLVTTEGGQLFLGEAENWKITFFDGIETQLYEEAGMWQAECSSLAEDIRARRFDHLVLYGGFSPKAFQDAVALYYDLDARHGNYTVFRPGAAARVAEMGPSGTYRTQGDWQVVEADVSSLHPETEGLAPADRSRPGYARLRLTAQEPMSWAQARFTVRLDPKDAKAAARWALKDARGRELASGAASREGRADVVVEAGDAGRELKLVVELEGNAWIEPVHGAVAVLRASY
ncbi:ArnT family glycosyltransferase [Fundidesulfovibrio terrae]|uniref:ArnT family glycosyltransferase n=1 Tax=Fundidesulfovibrio terrae TaxID=2922866 RepID=UPI001FAF79C0|nr:hypothetical protein [Fundidesulfovibrio terrae]